MMSLYVALIIHILSGGSCWQLLTFLSGLSLARLVGVSFLVTLMSSWAFSMSILTMSWKRCSGVHTMMISIFLHYPTIWTMCPHSGGLRSWGRFPPFPSPLLPTQTQPGSLFQAAGAALQVFEHLTLGGVTDWQGFWY